MNNLNEEEIMKALNNCKNENILTLTKESISKEKNDILQKLQLKGDNLKSFFKRLKSYKYISNPDDLNLGNYIRWINLTKNTINLTNGALIVKIFNNKGSVEILCRNNRNCIFKIKYDSNLIFQKLSNEENVIISLLSFLKK